MLAIQSNCQNEARPFCRGTKANPVAKPAWRGIKYARNAVIEADFPGEAIRTFQEPMLEMRVKYQRGSPRVHHAMDERQRSAVPRQAICLDAVSSYSRSPGISDVAHDQGKYKQRRRPCEQRSDYHCLCCGHIGSLMSHLFQLFREPSIELGNRGTAGLFLARWRLLRTFVEPSPIGFVALPLTLVTLAALGRAKLLETPDASG